jgi:23S rRNA-/tRNA-specific pseudouridylate synthase
MHYRVLARLLLRSRDSFATGNIASVTRSPVAKESRPLGTWLEVQLETGRTHQIRVQAASRGHPVLGDAQYGSTQQFGEQFEDGRLRAIALHARQLGFNHPMTGEPVDIFAPAPGAWHDLNLPEH